MRDHPIAKCVLSILSAAPRAPLRCDRGGFLYSCRAVALREAFESANFETRADEEMLYVVPTVAWVAPFEVWAAESAEPSELMRSLTRLRGREAGEGECALWITGIKLYELGAARGALDAYDRTVRQASARSLREGYGGGLLSACAACLNLIEHRAR